MANQPKIVKIKECAQTGEFQISDRKDKVLYKSGGIEDITQLSDILKGMEILKKLDKKYIPCDCKECNKTDKLVSVAHVNFCSYGGGESMGDYKIFDKVFKLIGDEFEILKNCEDDDRFRALIRDILERLIDTDDELYYDRDFENILMFWDDVDFCSKRQTAFYSNAEEGEVGFSYCAYIVGCVKIGEVSNEFYEDSDSFNIFINRDYGCDGCGILEKKLNGEDGNY